MVAMLFPRLEKGHWIVCRAWREGWRLCWAMAGCWNWDWLGILSAVLVPVMDGRLCNKEPVLPADLRHLSTFIPGVLECGGPTVLPWDIPLHPRNKSWITSGQQNDIRDMGKDLQLAKRNNVWADDVVVFKLHPKTLKRASPFKESLKTTRHGSQSPLCTACPPLGTYHGSTVVK